MLDAISASLNQGLVHQDWQPLYKLAQQNPAEVLSYLRRQHALNTTSPYHQPAILLLYGELALQQGLRIEAGWALYYARQLADLSAPLQQALLWTHPLWHQPVRGHRVVLYRPQQRHRDFLMNTLGDEAFTDKYHVALGSAEAAAEGYLARSRLPSEQLRQLDWVIETQAGKAIGVASIADLAFSHQRGELLLGFPDAAVSSLLTVEAGLLVLALAFHHLPLSRLVSYVYADNAPAQQATLNMGFSAESRLRRHIFSPSKPDGVDLLANGLLREDYVANARLNALYSRLLPKLSPAHLFQLNLQF